MNSRATFEATQIAGRRLVGNTICQKLTSGRRARRIRGGWWRRRKLGGIEQDLATCDNIEQVIPLSPIHIIR
jgi:hypothetical protein